MRPRLKARAALLFGVVLLAACGVSAERSAELADPETVPFGLLDEDRQPVAGSDGSGRAVEIFVYDEDQEVLVPVIRRVDDGSPESIVAELEQELSEDETSVDVRSPLAGVDAVREVESEGGVVTIDLSEDFAQISGADQLIAVAQLVYTVTARPGVGQVSFTLEGERVEVPLGDGSLTTGNVTREDYPTLAP